MKYLIMIRSNPAVAELFAGKTDEERAADFQLYFDIESELEASGELIESKALSETEQHVVRRGPDGPVVTDAPLPETTEVLSGFYLVDVADEARVAEIAVRFPEAEAEGGILYSRTLTDEDFAAMMS